MVLYASSQPEWKRKCVYYLKTAVELTRVDPRVFHGQNRRDQVQTLVLGTPRVAAMISRPPIAVSQPAARLCHPCLRIVPMLAVFLVLPNKSITKASMIEYHEFETQYLSAE